MTAPQHAWRTDQRCPICHHQFKAPQCTHSYQQVEHFLRQQHAKKGEP